MKRDFDLIREILFSVEKSHDGGITVYKEFPEISSAKFLYHCELLIERGLLKGRVEWTLGNIGLYVSQGLSWEGQDYLANIRNEDVWKQVKKSALDKGLDLTLEIIAILAAKYTKKMLES